MQHLSEYGFELLKQHEGIRLKAYRDPVGILTIGYGHTAGVKEGDSITPAQARNMLIDDISIAERCVRARVTVPLTQGQFDALVSFVFNVGCGAFATSSLLRHLNNGHNDKAALEFPNWVNAGRPKQRLPGLVNRRASEQRLFSRKDRV